MSRVNTCLIAGNGAGRRITMGGRRGAQDTVWAALNTDNKCQSDCGLHVKAQVIGERLRGGKKPRKTCHHCGQAWESLYAEPGEACAQCGEPRQGRDERQSEFTVTLPEAGGCRVELRTYGQDAAELLRVGAALCGVKALSEMSEGNTDEAIDTVTQALEIVTLHERHMSETLPDVILPTGHTLAHAMACVATVERMIQGKEVSTS